MGEPIALNFESKMGLSSSHPFEATREAGVPQHKAHELGGGVAPYG